MPDDVEPEFYLDGSDGLEEVGFDQDPLDDDGENDIAETDEPAETSDMLDPLIMEARTKLDEALASGGPITDPDIIRTMFGRHRG